MKSTDSDDFLRKVVDAAGDRLKVAGDIIDFDYCFVDTYEVDAKAYAKRIDGDPQATNLLAEVAQQLGRTEPFTAEAIKTDVESLCQRRGIKLGQIIHAIRVATTGQPGGFGMFETLELIGKDKSLQRISKVV